MHAGLLLPIVFDDLCQRDVPGMTHGGNRATTNVL